MQVVRTLQKAWRDLGSSRTNIRASGSDQGLWTLWLILLSPAVNQAALAAPKKIVTATDEFVAALL
jgi:hypothetical protein